MPIIRDDNRAQYKVIGMGALTDPRMSWKARGLLCYLLSRPDNWAVSVEQLAGFGPDGVSATRAAIKELCELGYMKRDDVRNADGTMLRRDYMVFENPHAENRKEGHPQCDYPHVENQHVDNLNVDKGRIESGPLGVGGEIHPQCDYPHLDYPHVENRTLINKELYLLRKELTSTTTTRVREEQNSEVKVNGFLLPPDITSDRSEWMPKLQGWILDLMNRDEIKCSIPEAAKIVERIAGSKLTDEERIRYLTDDIAAKAERVKSKKMDAALAVRCIGASRDVEWWKEAQKAKSAASPTVSEGGKKGRTYEDPFAWATDEEKRKMGVIK